MKRPNIHILANSHTIRAVRTVPGDPSLGEGRDGDHLAEIKLEPDLARPRTGYEERSDRLGRFEKGMPIGSQTGMAHGERHGEAAEAERRQTAAITASIESVLAAEGHPAWGLVAPPRLLGKIEQALGGSSAASLVAREKGDWTGEPIADVEARLLRHGS